ncbi:MAG: peptidoglycan-binding domain-containing protein [Paracoccaceae bacterium]
MLPNLKTAVIAATLAAAVAAAPAGPALAWGKGEQNFLAGVLATVAVGALITQSRKAQATTRAPSYQPAYRPAYQPAYQPRDDRRYIPTYGTPASAAHSAFLNYSPSMRRAIQTRLSDYGYYAGAIDGVWGPRTNAALRAFAADLGLSQRLGTYSGAVSVLDNLAA